MRTLLSVNNYHYRRGGAEAVFLDHNSLFRKNGWSVVPFCMQHEKNIADEWDQYFVSEIELGKSYGILEKIGKSAKAAYSLEAKSKINLLIDKCSPDIAHAHNIYHHLSPSILSVLANRGIPIVLTLHDLKLACPAYRMITHDGICERCKSGQLYNAMRHRCLHDSMALSAWVTVEAYLHRILGSYRKTVDRFVVPSKFYLNKLVEWGWERERFSYVPNFVDAEEIQPNYSPGNSFLYFGRLSEEKGLETLLRAAAKASVPVEILGTGPDRGSLEKLAVSLGANAEFRGFVSGAKLHDFLRTARAIVLPSEWYENAPISVLEAYAAGKPVIGADIGGIPELIDDLRGRVFEAFSVDSLASALETFATMGDEELREMGRNGRLYVQNNHSRQSYMARCSAIYNDLFG